MCCGLAVAETPAGQEGPLSRWIAFYFLLFLSTSSTVLLWSLCISFFVTFLCFVCVSPMLHFVSPLFMFTFHTFCLFFLFLFCPFNLSLITCFHFDLNLKDLSLFVFSFGISWLQLILFFYKFKKNGVNFVFKLSFCLWFNASQSNDIIFV